MDQYEGIEDKLYHKTHLKNDQIHYRVYVPSSLLATLLQYYHSHPLSGHRGIYKTFKWLQELAFWPGMWTDVKHHVRKCVKFQTLRHDNQKPAGTLQSITTTKPNKMLGDDIMGSLPRKHNKMSTCWFSLIIHDELNFSPCIMPPHKVLQQF